ncbi:MAG: hypothetical protein DWQ34_17495 [Planctomycetota bacterium]|nr:MAG: hypothetical protein DWQ34_17495 [Planctomycetota bacterium]REK28033.1 MAG: hypothetical protein DWQ41_06370 [Planctomycetota bacterium]REK37560.1 MAG: hypothetical protein DWQ45_06055 [Planctomycetota bacterium]
MAKVRQILKHVHVEIAKGTRRCRRNRDHRIRAGEPCLVIRDDAGPYSKNYCRECALPILKLCAADLRRFRDVLFPDLIEQAKTVARRPVTTEAVTIRKDVERIVGRPVNVTLGVPIRDRRIVSDAGGEEKQ